MYLDKRVSFQLCRMVMVFIASCENQVEALNQQHDLELQHEIA